MSPLNNTSYAKVVIVTRVRLRAKVSHLHTNPQHLASKTFFKVHIKKSIFFNVETFFKVLFMWPQNLLFKTIEESKPHKQLKIS